ncbi:galectin-7-like [Onthophagus taurus]|uniref:galectin-7-like n=1 Tax=Onthophagus taurus TaxID=166361 RepID=UPI000C208EBD|nr:galectin-12-like [Onthophagus taurus]
MEDTYYSWPLLKTFSPGCLIRLQGVANRNGTRFEISFQCDSNIDKSGCALSTTFSFDKHSFFVSKCYVPEKGWLQETRVDDVNVIQGEKFEIIVQCEVTKFKVALNGEQISDFFHVIPFTHVKLVELKGDVKLSLVSYEDCTFPNQEKIEYGYPLPRDN